MYLLQALGEQDNSLSSPLQGPQLFSSSALQLFSMQKIFPSCVVSESRCQIEPMANLLCAFRVAYDL